MRSLRALALLVASILVLGLSGCDQQPKEQAEAAGLAQDVWNHLLTICDDGDYYYAGSSFGAARDTVRVVQSYGSI